MTPKKPQHGYALVLALWVLTFLMMVSMTFVGTARTESTTAGANLRSIEGRAIAEAGVWLAVASAIADGTARSGVHAGTRDFEFGESTVSTEMRDVSGLINLNRASADLLDRAFAAAGVDSSSRPGIVNGILDWRDVDSDARAGGGETAAYDLAWGTVPVRNGSFMTVDELRAIPGVTHAVFESVRQLFTVFGNHVRINRQAAPARVMAVISDESGVPDRRFLQDRGENIFVVRSTTVVAGVTVTLSPVIHISPRADEAVSVLSWNHDES